LPQDAIIHTLEVSIHLNQKIEPPRIKFKNAFILPLISDKKVIIIDRGMDYPYRLSLD
jgi:hypothetical protein